MASTDLQKVEDGVALFVRTRSDLEAALARAEHAEDENRQLNARLDELDRLLVKTQHERDLFLTQLSRLTHSYRTHCLSGLEELQRVSSEQPVREPPAKLTLSADGEAALQSVMAGIARVNGNGQDARE